MTAFLLTSIVLFIIWLAILLFSNETRREQVIMSVVGLVLSPAVLVIVAEDYRQLVSDTASVVGIEDLIFAFSLFGIAAVIYQVLIGKHAHKLRKGRYEMEHVGHWIAHLVLVLGIWAFASLLFIHVFEISSINALIVGGLLVGIYIIADRHDLMMNALLSGLFLAALVFMTEQIFFVRLFPVDAAGFWQLDAAATFLIGGVPLQELIWAATVGFAIGPLYEWLRRIELK
jgi:hypothetical protein